MLTRRSVVAGLLAGMAQGAVAEPLASSLIPPPRPGSLKARAAPPAADLVSRANISGKTGFVLADAETGGVIEAYAPGLAVPPASTVKALTAAYGLQTLGSAHRFSTRLVATGPVSGGRLSGDLVLLGSGDPELDTEGLAHLAAELKATGLREITGKFLFYDSALPTVRAIDPEQPDHVGYNPALSGLNLNYNRVHFEWRRRAEGGWNVAMDARAGPYKPEVAVATMKIVKREAPIYTYAADGSSDRWTVAAGALGGDGSRWLPVRQPGLYTAEVFQTLARAHGIVLPRPQRTMTRPAGSVIARIDGRPLPEVLRRMLRWSTNLTAEVVGLTASQARGVNPQSLGASARNMARWCALDLNADKLKFEDHSGLGASSTVSPPAMIAALTALRDGGGVHGLMKQVALTDKNGKPTPNDRITIRAKTGTLNFVSGLVGYVDHRDGRRLAFAVFSADQDRRRKLSKAERERPPGGRAWTRRARGLQSALLNRWVSLYLT